MAYALNEGQGNLSANTRKTEEKHPDITGKAMIGGKLYQIAGWRKVNQQGSIWYSLSVKPEGQGRQQRQAPQQDNGPQF